MKIKFDKPKGRGEPIAYISAFGHLVIRRQSLDGAQHHHLAMLLRIGEETADAPAYIYYHWSPDDTSNQAVFYSGDSITITF